MELHISLNNILAGQQGKPAKQNKNSCWKEGCGIGQDVTTQVPTRANFLMLINHQALPRAALQVKARWLNQRSSHSSRVGPTCRNRPRSLGNPWAWVTRLLKTNRMEYEWIFSTVILTHLVHPKSVFLAMHSVTLQSLSALRPNSCSKLQRRANSWVHRSPRMP
jgi:hypothetical protein